MAMITLKQLQNTCISTMAGILCRQGHVTQEGTASIAHHQHKILLPPFLSIVQSFQISSSGSNLDRS